MKKSATRGKATTKPHRRKPMGRIKYKLDYDPRHEIRLLIGAGAKAKPVIERPMKTNHKGDPNHMVKLEMIRATTGPYPGTLEAIYRRI